MTVVAIITEFHAAIDSRPVLQYEIFLFRINESRAKDLALIKAMYRDSYSQFSIAICAASSTVCIVVLLSGRGRVGRVCEIFEGDLVILSCCKKSRREKKVLIEGAFKLIPAMKPYL